MTKSRFTRFTRRQCLRNSSLAAGALAVPQIVDPELQHLVPHLGLLHPVHRELGHSPPRPHPVGAWDG